jgi:beta-galactosidase beta subunit
MHGNINQYKTISNNMKQYKTTQSNIKQYQTISNNIKNKAAAIVNIDFCFIKHPQSPRAQQSTQAAASLRNYVDIHILVAPTPPPPLLLQRKRVFISSPAPAG